MEILKNTADEDACYVSKVWLFVFIWAGLAVFFNSDKVRFKVMATYLQQ